MLAGFMASINKLDVGETITINIKSPKDGKYYPAIIKMLGFKSLKVKVKEESE